MLITADGVGATHDLLNWITDGYATATLIRPPTEATDIHIPTQRSVPHR